MEGMKKIQLELDPTVLINEDVTDKRVLFRTIRQILTMHGDAAPTVVGKSIAERPINSLYNPDTHKEINATCHNLFRSYVDSCAGVTPQISLNHDPLSRRLTNVASIFSDTSYRFTGTYTCTRSLFLH